MTHPQLQRTCDVQMSAANRRGEVSFTHASGRGEGCQIINVWRKPNSSDALGGGSYGQIQDGVGQRVVATYGPTSEVV